MNEFYQKLIDGINLKTLNDDNKLMEINSILETLSSSNETANKLLALKMASQLNENPHFKTLMDKMAVLKQQQTQ